MNFSAYSIKNPLVAILLFTLFSLGGLLAFDNMKIQQFPDIDVPAVVVTVAYSGASPAQLETDVAKKNRKQNRIHLRGQTHSFNLTDGCGNSAYRICFGKRPLRGGR